MPSFIVMRHSVRLDLSEDAGNWEDASTRPHDTPISDSTLPKTVAAELKKEGFNIKHIWSSPYRRCLQTAAAAATQLGIGSVTVHHGLSEVTTAALRCVSKRGLDSSFIETGEAPMYLSKEEKAAALGDLDFVDADTHHFYDLTSEASKPRYLSVLAGIRAAHADVDGDVLIVTHGAAVAAVAESTLHIPSHDVRVDYCGTVAVDAAGETLLHLQRVHTIQAPVAA